MTAARWDKPPANLREGKPKRSRKRAPASERISYRCAGIGGCGAVHDRWPAAERCADSHHGARVEMAIPSVTNQAR